MLQKTKKVKVFYKTPNPITSKLSLLMGVTLHVHTGKIGFRKVDFSTVLHDTFYLNYMELKKKKKQKPKNIEHQSKFLA